MSLFAFSLAGSAAIAQVPVGSLVALTSDLTTQARQLFVLPAGGGVPTAIAGSAPTMSGTIQAVGVDTVSPFVDPGSAQITRGHLVVATQTSSGNELWQLYLSGSQIVGDRKLVDLPSGIVLELHRSAGGCFMALTTSGNTGVLSRISITENGASVFHQTLGGLAANGTARGLTSGPDGYAYVAETFPVSMGVLPPSRLARVGTDGQLSTIGSSTFTVSALAYNGTTPGSALAAGGVANFTVGTNFSCGGGEVSFGPALLTAPGLFWPVVQDIELDAANGTFLVALGGGSIGGTGTFTSEIRRYGATGCSLSGPTVLASFTNQIALDVSLSTGAVGYGCASPTSGATYPVIGQVAPPSVGMVWQPNLANATPSSFAQLYIGFDTLFYLGLPLPLDASALGAQPGAALVTSGTLVNNTATDPSGAANFSIAVPNNPTLIGIRTYAQWVVVDVALPYTLPIAMSAAIGPAIQ